MRDWLATKVQAGLERIRGLPERQEKQILRGNPEIGSVYHVRQVHFSKENTREQNNAITRLQMVLLDELEQGSYDAVVIESLPTGWDIFQDKHLDEVQAAFYGYTSGTISPEQRRLLLELGAAAIHCLLHPAVTPIPGASYGASLQSNIGRYGNTARKREEARIAREYVRERIVARRVRAYLDGHPGARVALCYGTAHNFGFDFQRDLPRSGLLFKQFGQRARNDRPDVYEVEFPHETDKVGMRSRSAREYERLRRRKEKREPFIQGVIERLEHENSTLDKGFEEAVEQRRASGIRASF